MSDVKTPLREAKALLLKEGWVQHAYSSAWGFCLAGALRYVAQDDADCAQALEALVSENKFLKGLQPLNEIIFWNDDPRRTKEQVIDLIDRALASLPPDPETEEERQRRERLLETEWDEETWSALPEAPPLVEPPKEVAHA